jgi:hypothetical protein
MPTYTMKGPDGRVYQLQAGDDVSREKAEAELRRRIGAQLGKQPSAAPEPKPETPKPERAPTDIQEESYLSTLGRSFRREGLPTIKKGLARIVEDYPEIVGSLFSTLSPGNAQFGQVATALGKAAAKSETYKGLTGETVGDLRKQAEATIAAEGPRKYKGVFEEEGALRKLASLGETVAGSALPVGAGVATGLLTRSPVAAGAVMTGGSVPMAYGGIRQRQQDEGIDDVQRAVIGTVASSALDVLTGVGGKVLSGTAAAAARELLEAGLKQAAIRVVKSGGEEAGTEMLQNVVEQVAGGTNPATKKAILETLESGLAGALGGTVFTGATEAVAAPFRPKAGATDADVTINAAVRQEFGRLVTEEVNTVMAADPAISRDQAVNAVMERAEEISAQATDNIAKRAEAEVAAEGEADVVPDADTGMDVTGGVGAGVAPDIEPSAAATGAPDLGEAVAGGLERPVPSVPVPAVGEGAGVSPLTATPAPEVVAPTPVLEPEMVAPVPAPVFDITPIMEAPTLKERTSVAKQLASEIVATDPELQGLPAATYGKAVNQMARSAARGEQFDPVDIVYNVAGIERPAPVTPAPAFEPAAAPAVPAAPSVDEVAVAPVKAAIEAAAAPTPAAGPIPTLAQASAREVGITHTPPPPPPVQAAPTPAAPITPPAPPEMAAPAAPVTPPPVAAAPDIAAPPEMAAPTITPPPAAPEMAALPPLPEMAAPTIEPTPAPPAPPAVRTVNDMAGIGTVNPDNTNEVLVEGGGIQLTPLADNILKVDSLRAVETGGGRKAMEQLTKVADANGTELQLSPEPFAAEAGKEMTPTELTEWYSGFGFQEQPDGTMVRPAPTAAPSTITPAAAATPQEILTDLDSFAISEAQDRDLDQDAFLEGVDDIRSGREPLSLPDALKTYGSSGKFEINDPNAAKADSRVAGAQWAQERVAEAQAATPAPVEVAPAAPAVQEPVQEPVQAAMETAPEGGVEPVTDANVDAAVSVKLTKAQIRRLEEAAGIQRMKLNNMQKRIARSRSAEETMSLAGKLMLLSRNPNDSVNILTSLFNSVPPPILQRLLAPLETADVVRLGQRAGMENVTRIDNMIRDEYVPYVNRIMQRASKLAEKWADFTSRSPEGANAMSDVMFFSNMTNADPSLAPTAAEYLKIDPEFQALRKELGNETDVKKKSAIQGQITKRRGEIQRLYFGATDPDGTKVSGWNDVPPQGKQLFREARDYYRADFQEHYRLLIQRIDDAQFEEEQATRLKAAVDKMFKDASERVIYFPLKRFGDYWVSVGKGKSGEFHMFESASEQDAFINQLRRDGESREIDFSKGKDTLRLGIRNQTADASAALKGILDLIDGGGVSDVDLLKDHIFQMYLTALPEADMRRRFIHRQFKTGFSTDTLRTFASTAIASANQLGRLAYNYKLNNLIDQSYAETSGNPSKRRLDTITNELRMRVEDTMSPEAEDGWQQAANFGAKATFLFILSSPKSAIMNLTQLHIVGLPTLSAEFGEKDTFTMAARYTGQMLTGQRIANPFRNEDGDIQLQTPNFTTEGSAYIRGLRETDPDRYEAIQKAWDYAQQREVTESTFSSAANVYDRSGEPSGELNFTQAVRQGDAAAAVQRATANAVNAMGALFHHTERIGREVMYMSAFELAYDRNLKNGMKSDAAADAAMAKAAELTNKGMFDFSNWNKSRAAKHPVGKLALQMRSYSIAMTSLLFRSFSNMVALQRTKAERLAAARVFFGVGAMTTLYGGLRASQFYLMAMLGFGLYEYVKSAFDDDDEEQEIEQGYLNPETFDKALFKYADEQGRELSKKNMDYHIRTAWIPETLGEGGTMQTALGLSDGAAKKLAAASDMGIPAIFGVDISNSVALTNLWHPVDTKSDNPDARFYEAVGRILFGPSASMPSAIIKFNAEANAGNLDKAIEAVTPAFVRGYVKAERLKDEGLVIGKDRDIVLKDPSFYDTYTLAMQSLGFPEAETSRNMQLDIAAGDIEKAISEERTKLLDQRYRAVLNTINNPGEEAERELAKVERDMEIYSLNYPSNAISEDAKKKSFKAKSVEADEKMYGMGMNEKIPVREPLAEERTERFLEGQ